MLSTPTGNFCNQIKLEIIPIWDLNCPFAEFQSTFCKFLRKVFNCLRSRVNSNMLLYRCKMNDVMVFPLRWHGPGNLFFCKRQLLPDRIPNCTQIIPVHRILLIDIFVNQIRYCTHNFICCRNASYLCTKSLKKLKQIS